jgi:hypothetical protein
MSTFKMPARGTRSDSYYLYGQNSGSVGHISLEAVCTFQEKATHTA